LPYEQTVNNKKIPAKFAAKLQFAVAQSRKKRYTGTIALKQEGERIMKLKGRLKPYLPELTIRDYNTYLWYSRGVRLQLYLTYGLYSCRVLRHNGVLAALLADSLAGRTATCKKTRIPGTLRWLPLMCQTKGIRLAAQMEILMGWHDLQDRRFDEMRFSKRIRRVLDRVLLRHAYLQAVQENPSMERLFVQERAQAIAEMNMNTTNYGAVAEPMSNIYGALYSALATEDPGQKKSMRYIGTCIGRAFYVMDKAERFDIDVRTKHYNVFIANGIKTQEAAIENARRQALAAANDLVRVYNMLDIKLNQSLLDNIMLLGLRHALDPLEQGEAAVRWELP